MAAARAGWELLDMRYYSVLRMLALWANMGGIAVPPTSIAILIPANGSGCFDGGVHAPLEARGAGAVMAVRGDMCSCLRRSDDSVANLLGIPAGQQHVSVTHGLEPVFIIISRTRSPRDLGLCRKSEPPHDDK